jgi:DNA-binding HxlR family transcriptional regulator
MTKEAPKMFRCPTELTLNVLGGKWNTVLLSFLTQRSCRHAELRILMPNLTNKRLNKQLGNLIRAGLVTKRMAPGAKRIEIYVPTPRMHSLSALLCELYGWGKSHAAEFGAETEDPLNKLNEVITP